ncbi:MAG: hypothetical protein JNL40_03575 [Cyclobacteriaceae bacterium]|nr:hypothetical protein [Cyclobacteriaceae bacterium]
MIQEALRRCKVFVLSVFVIYWLSGLVGMIMVHQGNQYALSYRDNMVQHALATDKASIHYGLGNRFTAAVIDFGENLVFGAIPQTLMGFGVVIPLVSVSIQGWMGGIVSVDADHKSRLRLFQSACYYLLVLLLQFIPYSLVIGAGVKCGIDFYVHNKINSWSIGKYRFQKESLRDLALIYLLAIPLFFLASCYEFLSPWNA